MKRILSLWLTVAIVLVPWVAFGQESEPPPPSQMFDRLADTYAALSGLRGRSDRRGTRCASRARGLLRPLLSLESRAGSGI